MVDDLVVEEVADRLWCLRRRSYLTCSYLVGSRANPGWVLIDTGMDSGGSDVQAGLRAAGAEWTDIRAIIVTHWHNDHAAGAAEAHDRSGAPVFCGEAEVPYVTRSTRRPGWLGRLGDRWPEQGPLVLLKGILTNAPHRAVGNPTAAYDGDVIEGFEVVETPGHTPGHLAVWEPQSRTLFSGDALAVVDGDIRRMARPVTPEVQDAERSMARVLDLRPVRICPGHRNPIEVTAEQVDAARASLGDGSRWPLFG